MPLPLLLAGEWKLDIGKRKQVGQRPINSFYFSCLWCTTEMQLPPLFERLNRAMFICTYSQMLPRTTLGLTKIDSLSKQYSPKLGLFWNALYFLIISDTNVWQLVRKNSNILPTLIKFKYFLPTTIVCLEHKLNSHLPGTAGSFRHTLFARSGILWWPSLPHHVKVL